MGGARSSPREDERDSLERIWFDGNAEEAVRFYTSVFDSLRDSGRGPRAATRRAAVRLAEGAELELLADSKKVPAVMSAVLKMKKIDLEAVRKAAA